MNRKPKEASSPQMHFGRSVRLVGQLTGAEDVTIDGAIEGQVVLKDHALTIGQHGRIRGDVFAVSVVVVGNVAGNITASKQVEVRGSGRVEGDIAAPSVLLAEGARFSGRVDMNGVPALPEWAQAMLAQGPVEDAVDAPVNTDHGVPAPGLAASPSPAEPMPPASAAAAVEVADALFGTGSAPAESTDTVFKDVGDVVTP
ncbi:MAG: polymer-forming cytoskeletal protein [Planctomycetota bacterium]